MATLLQIEIAVLDLIPVMNFLLLYYEFKVSGLSRAMYICVY